MEPYEVTKELWDVVYTWAIANGYHFDNVGGGKGPNHPVQMVNWFDCVKWLNARSEMEGLRPVYYLDESMTQVYRRYWATDQLSVDPAAEGYRLPTIAEREYAARGGVSSRRFSWADSDEIHHLRANYYSRYSFVYDIRETSGHHPVYDDGNMPYTAPVGSFAPNGYGLYDMTGNVAEWCDQPCGHLAAVCGGSWNTGPEGCRIGDRDFYDKFITRNHVGFRSVRNVNP
jgi:sulfatase modifying factor 1